MEMWLAIRLVIGIRGGVLRIEDVLDGKGSLWDGVIGVISGHFQITLIVLRSHDFLFAGLSQTIQVTSADGRI